MNPYRRLLELCGITQRAFAEYASLSPSTVTGLISGQYPELSDHMVLSLGRLCHEKQVDAAEVLSTEYGIPKLRPAYKAWCKADRLAHAESYAIKLPTGRTGYGLSPLHNYIKATAGSQQAMCKELHIGKGPLFNYLTGRQKTMPNEIREALLQVGGPVEEIEKKQAAWQVKYAG